MNNFNNNVHFSDEEIENRLSKLIKKEEYEKSYPNGIRYDDYLVPEKNEEIKQFKIEETIKISDDMNDKLEFLSQDIGNTQFGYEIDDSQDLINKKNILNTFIQKLLILI